MTVGIGALSNADADPKVVMAADRMVTVGKGSGIEYENTDSKLQVVVDSGGIVAMAIGSGSLTLIDDVIRRLENQMVTDPPKSMEELMEKARKAYQEMERETINNNVLSTFNIDMSDIMGEETNVPHQFQETIINDIASVRETIRENVNILFGGVSDGSGYLFTLSSGDFTPYTNTGYCLVGSGSGSGQLTFIRNRYDPDDANLTEALFSVGEAKIQAEERQGVGQEMDVAIVSSDGVEQVQDIENLRRLLQEVETEQQKVRQKVMRKWEK